MNPRKSILALLSCVVLATGDAPVALLKAFARVTSTLKGSIPWGLVSIVRKRHYGNSTL
jgi:hypothetical protein